MRNLPTGTVTFLFTDLEGSTRRWEESPAAMQVAFSRQEVILRSAIEANGGYAYKMIGDAFQVAFPTAPQALQAAFDAQRALHSAEWPPETGEIKVRMALHTGVAEERGDDYVGPILNRVARLLSAAHGGQALLSSVTYGLVVDNLPRGTTLLDLGEHRLKDLSRPEHVFQLVISGMPSTFPPLNSLDAHPNNLPAQATAFVGREKEVETIVGLLGRSPDPAWRTKDSGQAVGAGRLLTLTGPGGTGKTRLALQAAAALTDSFADGVFFVPLAYITEPAFVAPAVAQALGVRDGGGRPVVANLAEYLQDKHMLLLLDNFEQVLGAASLVVELLARCARLTVLVTSREVLHVYGEREFPVPPLDLPNPRHLPSLERLTQYEAVRLFIERAALVKPDFTVTDQNAPAIAEICYRLDGLPLAIELAAARVKLLSPFAMLQRLQSTLKMLTGGARDLPTRQQTLRGAIDWSYDLLDDEEKKLFRRLAVFVGGSTVEAVEIVCNASEDLADVFEVVASLVDKSLLFPQEVGGEREEPRFRMLETIREYALERLEESGEAQDIGRRHADFYLTLVEAAEPHFIGPGHQAWLDRFEIELDNIRAALRWLITQGDAQLALRLAGSDWVAHGQGLEGRRWIEEALALPGAQEPTAARAKALAGVAGVAWPQGDIPAARAAAEESAAIYRKLGDTQGLVTVLITLAVTYRAQGDFDRAAPIFEEALAVSREAGLELLLSMSLLGTGHMALAQGNYGLARERIAEGLSRARAMGNKWLVGQLANGMGDVERLEGQHSRAARLYRESLASFREADAKLDIPAVLHNLGHVALVQGDHAQARALFAESLALHQELGNTIGIAESLAGFAGIAAALSQQAEHTGEARRAACLFGASEALRETMGAPMWPAEQADWERNWAIACSQLDEETWQLAWKEGHSMTMEQAIGYAVGHGQSQRATADR